jgi:hypothetical protein
MRKHPLVLHLPSTDGRPRGDGGRQTLKELKKDRATVQQELLAVEWRIAALRAAGVSTEPDPAAAKGDSSVATTLRDIVLPLYRDPSAARDSTLAITSGRVRAAPLTAT